MKKAFRNLFELSGEIIEHYLENKSDSFLTQADLEATTNLAELTKIEDNEKFDTYFSELFRKRLYNKENKYLFLWGHMKLYGYIVKNKMVLCLGENVSEEKKQELNTSFPIYKVFVYANALKISHEKKIKENEKVYTELDYDFTVVFKYFEALYDILFYLEKKTAKKNQLREIRDWSRKRVTGEPDEEEFDFEKIKKESIARAKSMDIKGTMKSFGIEIPDDIDIEGIINKAFESEDSEGVSMMDKMALGDFSSLNAGMMNFGNPEIEEIDEEIYEEIEDDFEDDFEDEVD